MGESSGLLKDSFASVKTRIEKGPNTQATRDAVQETLDEVLDSTQGFQRFNQQDFTNLMRTVIIAVGYTRGGVTNVRILNELAASVPSQLGVESLFPEVREDGKRGLWLVGSAVVEADRYVEVMGESYTLRILGQCGRYAYFVAGVFPDLLLANERKKGVDVRYFETWGSAAFDMASKQTIIGKTDTPEIFRELAANFQGYRRMLNVAGGLVGTLARKTVAKEIVESYLATQQGSTTDNASAKNPNGVSLMFRSPVYNVQIATPPNTRATSPNTLSTKLENLN